MAANRNDDLFEMVDLEAGQTGGSGTITIMSHHALREAHVRWYEGPPGDGQGFEAVSIEAEPRVLTFEGLTESAIQSVIGDLSAWVQLNREKLHRFWNEAAFWYDREVERFVFSLSKLPRQPKARTELPLSENPY